MRFGKGGLMRFEYRIGWSASSNASFSGQSDWMVWEGHEQTIKEVKNILNETKYLPLGLEEAIELSGFEWWTEVRLAT